MRNLRKEKSMSPNDFGEKNLVDMCVRVDISTFLKKFKTNLKQLLLETELELLNAKVSLTTSNTGYGGIRFWFKCPLCMKRVGTLYKHPLQNIIACRTCLNLNYRKRRYKGMVEEKII